MGDPVFPVIQSLSESEDRTRNLRKPFSFFGAYIEYHIEEIHHKGGGKNL
jgi:hypothetical protein